MFQHSYFVVLYRTVFIGYCVRSNFLSNISKRKGLTGIILILMKKTEYERTHSKQIMSLASYTAFLFPSLTHADGLNFGNILKAAEWSFQLQKRFFCRFLSAISSLTFVRLLKSLDFSSSEVKLK